MNILSCHRAGFYAEMGFMQMHMGTYFIDIDMQITYICYYWTEWKQSVFLTVLNITQMYMYMIINNFDIP